MVGPILIIKLDDASADDAIAPCGGQVAGGRAVRHAVRQAVRWSVGCVCASSLGRRAGSGAARFVAAYGCVSASSLVRAGRQRRQRVNQETRLG